MKKLSDLKLMAILRDVDAENIIDIIDVLLDEEIGAVEISLSNPQKGFACLERARAHYSPDALYLGAGTVLRPVEVDRLAELSLPFCIMPGFHAALVDYALEKGLDVLPGVLTPSDVQQAVIRDIHLLKLFPADAYPLSYIKSLKGPFPLTEYWAVGGVTRENIAQFFAAGFKGAAVGSDLVPRGATRADLTQIRNSARFYSQAIR